MGKARNEVSGFRKAGDHPAGRAIASASAPNAGEARARTYFEKLCPESPKAVYEATRWTVPIDRVNVSGPILVVSSELDHLTPPAIGRSLATFYGADYRYLRGRGHNILLEPNWRETASMVAAWLGRETRSTAKLPMTSVPSARTI